MNVAILANEEREGDKMPTNSNLLRGCIAEKGYTQSGVAKMIGITYQFFSEKVNNKSQFKVGEIMQLCNVLDISDKDLYFFAN